MKTTATNKKVSELITMVREGKLVLRPEFQRRLVWSRDDKNLFLDTVLRGMPFPEIYLADGTVDLESGEGTQLLVDGLQRVTTLTQYFLADESLRLTMVPPYKSLAEEEKRRFLHYEVAVRDLGLVTRKELVDVFQRLNATKYSLRDIEINNAVYSGSFKKMCESLTTDPFFSEHSVFTPQDLRRMGDLRYVIAVVITMLSGYFNRDDEFEEFLARYNDDFPDAEPIKQRLSRALNFIDDCDFSRECRVWKKADLFTLIIEVDSHFENSRKKLSASRVFRTLNRFFEIVDAQDFTNSQAALVYYKAALQASNDKGNRVRRGLIISKLLDGEKLSEISIGFGQDEALQADANTGDE